MSVEIGSYLGAIWFWRGMAISWTIIAVGALGPLLAGPSWSTGRTFAASATAAWALWTVTHIAKVANPRARRANNPKRVV